MTNPSLNFDTLACVKELVQAGFPTEQAEAQTRVLAKFVNENLATKQSLDIVKFELKKDIELIKKDIELIKRDIELIKRDMATKTDIELIKRDIVIKLGSMIAGSVLLLAGVIRFLH